MKTLLKKELVQNWRLFRLPAFFLAALFFALLDPPITKYMEEILSFAAGDIEIILPDPSGEQALTQFFSSVGQIVYLVLIIVSMGIVSVEKEGALSWIVTQPVRRSNYIAAKFIIMAVAILTGVLGAGLVAYLYTGTLLEFVPLGAFLAGCIAVAVYGVYLFSITLLGSILFRTTWAAGGLGLAAMFITPLFFTARGILPLLAYSPYGLLANAQLAISGAFDGAALATLLLSTTVVILVLVFISISIFKQQELG